MYDNESNKVEVGAVDVGKAQAVEKEDDSDNYSEYSAITAKKGGPKSAKSAGATSVTVTRHKMVGNRRSCFLNYFIAFVIKHPLINPIFTKHPRVP